MAYLDGTGLAEVWAKAKAYFGRSISLGAVNGTSVAIDLKNAAGTPDTLASATIPAATTSAAGVMSTDQVTALDNATTKLAGIAAGAEVNVQSDWNVTSTTSDAYIKNKPTIPDSTSDLTNDSGFITSADVPSASTAAPSMDGTAAVGTSDDYARADHVHPSDSSKASVALVSSVLKLAGRNSNIWHGTCSTAYSTSTKVVVLDGSDDFSLEDGVVVAVTFDYGWFSTSTASLNVAGTGAKGILLPDTVPAIAGQSSYPYVAWAAGETVLFTYSAVAGRWLMAGSGGLQSLAMHAGINAMPKSGGTFTGAPMYASDPADDNTLTRKAYVDAAIADAIGDIQGISYEVVSSLPSTGEAGVIYLLGNSGTAPNVYDEYIWVSNAWEKIGTTAVDLSGYWSKTELVAMTVAEVDAICV